MKKKIIALLLLSALTLSACGAQQSPQSESPNQNISAAVSNENSSALESKITLDIPADFVGETTQEELTKTAAEMGYESITLNADGSVTCVITKSQHEEMLNGIKEDISNSLNELVGSEDYPNFTNIKANDNFSEFTVSTSSNELDMNESFSTLMFYTYGGMYAVFSGETVDNISVTFVNSTSGDIITTANSSDSQ